MLHGAAIAFSKGAAAAIINIYKLEIDKYKKYHLVERKKERKKEARRKEERQKKERKEKSDRRSFEQHSAQQLRERPGLAFYRDNSWQVRRVSTLVVRVCARSKSLDCLRFFGSSYYS
ncbi:hypothetical protein V1477_018783 [Vespula maculifrons]|uniref:Uncharacterized protein n=1 Tax=Vespula maculifrons TaxID=7453 RepID=A0ABD2AWC5_VESMC